MADELASGYRPSQRRQFIEHFAFIRFSSSLLPGVLWAKLQEQKTQNDLAVFRTSLTRRLLHKLVKTGLDLSTHHAQSGQRTHISPWFMSSKEIMRRPIKKWGAVSFRAARTAEEKAHAESDTENMRESLRVSGRRGYWENSLRIIQRNSKRPVEALPANETRASSAYALATAYAALREKDEAFVWLENLYETHEIASIQLKLNPAFDSLSSDARFAGLLHRMGLPQ